MLADRTLNVSAAALVLAALVASHGALAQPVLDLASGDAELELLDRIGRIEAEEGPRSAELIAPLRALGLLYQESGDHGLAAAAVDRALGLVRMNHGLHSLDQAPLIREQIGIARARNDLMEAWNLEQALLVLARRHPDDVRTIEILHEIADRRVDMLERYVDGEFPPQIVFGCYYDGAHGETILPAARGLASETCTAGYRGVAIRSILWEAQMDYSDAIKVAIGNDLYSSGELRELEMKLVRSSFLYGAMYEDGRDYALGRESLRRLAAYEAAIAAPSLVQIEALIRIADWDILFSRSRNLQESALTIYERAYRRLRRSGQDEATIERIFSPETPVVLPTFLPNPLVAEDTRAAAEYVDVAFEVTREGKGRNVRIVEATTESKRAARRQVTELVLRSRFRPRLVDGQFADSAPIVLRYYLNGATAGREEP